METVRLRRLTIRRGRRAGTRTRHPAPYEKAREPTRPKAGRRSNTKQAPGVSPTSTTSPPERHAPAGVARSPEAARKSACHRPSGEGLNAIRPLGTLVRKCLTSFNERPAEMTWQSQVLGAFLRARLAGDTPGRSAARPLSGSQVFEHLPDRDDPAEPDEPVPSSANGHLGTVTGTCSPFVAQGAPPDSSVHQADAVGRDRQQQVGVGRHPVLKHAHDLVDRPSSGDQRLTTMQHDLDPVKPMRPGVLGDPTRGLANQLVGHSRRRPMAPRLIGELVHVAVVAHQIAAKLDLQDELAKRHRTEPRRQRANHRASPSVSAVLLDIDSLLSLT